MLNKQCNKSPITIYIYIKNYELCINNPNIKQLTIYVYSLYYNLILTISKERGTLNVLNIQKATKFLLYLQNLQKIFFWIIFIVHILNKKLQKSNKSIHRLCDEAIKLPFQIFVALIDSYFFCFLLAASPMFVPWFMNNRFNSFNKKL